MDLQGHMETLGVNDSDGAKASRLSIATIRMAKAGRPLGKQEVGWLLGALSQKYGRTIAREEVEGLLVAEDPQV